MLDWQPLRDALAGADDVLITCHVRPDGDALGSEIAMARLLSGLGKRVRVFNSSPTPSRYGFLLEDDLPIAHLTKDQPEDGVWPEDPDLILVLDTGTWGQLAGLADWVRKSPAKKLVIDHHLSQDELGGERIVDTSYAACGLMCHEAYAAFGKPVGAHAANALFTAIAMDTGWMRHPNTTPRVFEAQAELVAAGAKPSLIYRHLFETNTPQRLALTGTMLGGIALHAGGRLAVATVTHADIAAAGAHPMDTEDFIVHAMSIAGVEAALFLVEQDGGRTKVSFRSRGAIDCRAIAERFGGGGHKAAAGATLDKPLPEAKAEVVAALEAEMER